VTLRNDPRSPATPAALAAQLALQLRIVAALRAAWEGYQRVKALGAAADSVPGAEGGRAAGGSAAARTFRSIGNTLASQLNAQDNADLAPTPAMAAAFASVCRDLAAVRAAWERSLRVTLPAGPPCR
jgi:hypothetical protein